MTINKKEKTGPHTYEMEIAFEADALKQAVSAVYKKTAKKYNVPGFRKGHAPRNLIEKMYGEDVFFLDAINELFPEAYEQAVKEAGIDPVDRPNADILSMDLENGAVVKVDVTIRPELNIGKYKGLAATRVVKKVEEKQIDDEIDRMRQRNARLLTREDAAQDGDIANIDYEGSVDGVPFDGGKDDGYKLTLGSGSFIPGFEEQVVGHKAGEEFDVNVTFPEEYHAKELAGKAAVFKVKLHEIQYKELPELDDEFAKDVSEYDTLNDLKESIREKMQGDYDKEADLDAENKLVDQIVETIEGEIPHVMIHNRMDDLVRDFAFRLEQQGLNLETYLKYTGMDAESFKHGFHEQAEKQVQMRLALETVARLENLVATEEDVNNEVARIAKQYEIEEDKVRSAMSTEDMAKDLVVNKAIDFVKENATITDEEAKEEKAEAKKPAKKTTKKAKAEAEE